MSAQPLVLVVTADRKYFEFIRGDAAAELTFPEYAPERRFLLNGKPHGSWSVVDLGSINGTYLNLGAVPLKPNLPTPLAPGDRIHVGVWTTLTLSS